MVPPIVTRWLHDRRAAAVRRTADRMRDIEDDVVGSGRVGPPAVAFARARSTQLPGICIDPLETNFSITSGGVRVRAWIIVSNDDIPAHALASIERTARKFDRSDPRLKRAFFLSSAYGLRIADIAQLMGMRRWRIRHLLLESFARLDDR